MQLKIVASYSAQRMNANQLNAHNYVGVDNLISDKKGKINSSYVPKIGQFTEFRPENILLGNIRPYLKKIWFANCVGGTNGDVLVIQGKDNLINPRFLYHIMASDSFFEFDTQHSKGAKMPRGNKDSILSYEFVLPTLERQAQIAELLDKFDSYCNDIQQGLPAEIEARQKQYEYYRDKLLTFKKLEE